MKPNHPQGFTIVELVIVIAVIAILAAVLIPTFSGLTDRAKKNAALQEAKNTYTAFLTEQGTAIQNHNLIIQQGDNGIASAESKGTYFKHLGKEGKHKPAPAHFIFQTIPLPSFS